MTQSRLTIGFMLAACAAVVGYISLPEEIQALVHPVIGAVAVICVLTGVQMHRPAVPQVWYALASGLVLLVIGDVILSLSDQPFPSVVDAFYLLGNLGIVAASALVIRARSHYRDMGSFIDAAILATTAAFLVWTFLMQPYATDPSLTGLQKIVSLAYPAITALMFVTGARLVFTRGRRAPSFYLIMAAIVSSLFGDVVYSELVLRGEYYPGHPIDLAYVLWYIFWAAAALHPSMTSVTSGSDAPIFWTSNRRMLFLVATVLLVPAATAIRWMLDISVSAPAFVGFSTLLFLLVFWRMRNSVRLSESAFAERQHALERERVLHDVASGLAVSSTRDDAFNAITTSLRSIATDHVCVQIALINGDTGRIINSCDSLDHTFNGRSFPIHSLNGATLAGLPGSERSQDIKRSLRYALAQSNPGVQYALHVANPEDATPIVLMLAGQWMRQTELADLLRVIGVQLLQAIERISLAEDISRRKNQEVFHSLVRNSSDVTMIINPDGDIRYVSPAAHTALGFAPDDLVGARLREFIHPDDVTAVEAFMTHVSREPGSAKTIEFRLKNSEDAWQDVEAVANNLLDDPDVGGVVLNVHDISVRKRSEALLEYQAFHDALTSLPNRALFLDRLAQIMRRAHAHDEHVAVLFVDLDRFKFINDSLGHDGGDALLIMASQRIRHCVAADDTVARLGGDEFTVILNSSETAAMPSVVASRLVKKLSEPFFIKDRELVVTVSIGVAVLAPYHESSEDLLREADIAMYQAKSQGRNGFVVFDAEMGLSMERQIQLEQDLRRALGNNEFVLHYQPEIDLESGRIVWFEALTRWQHPIRGLLHPAEFIPLAEESGLILQLGKWAIREACSQAQKWKERFPDYPFGVSVNLSPRQLLDPELADEIKVALQKTKLTPACLRMEITETTLMQEMEVSLRTLNALRALGVQLAIDDFGHGYSSLGYLRYFPLDTLKLDRSFLIDSVRPDQDDAIIQAVTTLAHSLDIRVTVEGIETPEQLTRVKSLACDQGQGFLFARPRPATQIPAMLASDPMYQGEAFVSSAIH